MKPNLIRIATRRSPLAMWQSHDVKRRIEDRYPEIKVELITFVTRGDKILDTSLAKIGGKGLFVKELEHALLAGDADIAVHSMKDVPMSFPEGLGLAAICEREDPSDAFVSNRFGSLAELPVGARVGTSSLRRQCQLRERRPDLDIQDLRGNVNTRLQRLDKGDYDAIILATAGLVRLEFADRIRERIAFDVSLPAGGQGAVGIEAVTDDASVAEILGSLHHEPTSLCVSAERAMNKWLEGGCQVPIAGFAELSGDLLTLRGLVGSPNGKQILRATLTGNKGDAESIGISVAKDLLSQGADKILEQVYANAAL